MGAEHNTLSLFREVRAMVVAWQRTDPPSELAKLLAGDEWCANLAYPADRFHHLNEVKTWIPVLEENLITSTDKINGFLSKVWLWQLHVESTNVDMFPLTKPGQEANTAALCETIGKHLETLEEKLLCYFWPILLSISFGEGRDFAGAGGANWHQVKIFV